MAGDGPLPARPVQLPHKRLKTAQPLLCRAILTVAACCPSWFDDMWITDATPVPCGMSRETVKRSDLAGHAGYGYCASHSRWYWGLKLYLVCAGDGVPIMWWLADPKSGNARSSPRCWSATTISPQRLIRSGQILLADKGFSGKPFKHLTEQMGLCLLRPDRTDETYTNGSLSGVRQWIESVNQTPGGPTRPRRPRRPHPRRCVHPRRAAPAGHDYRDLAQLGHRRDQQAVADRLRPLNTNFTESFIKGRTMSRRRPRSRPGGRAGLGRRSARGSRPPGSPRRVVDP